MVFRREFTGHSFYILNFTRGCLASVCDVAVHFTAARHVCLIRELREHPI